MIVHMVDFDSDMVEQCGEAGSQSYLIISNMPTCKTKRCQCQGSIQKRSVEATKSIKNIKISMQFTISSKCGAFKFK